MPEKSRLMPISYYNPKQEVRLSAYAALSNHERKQRQLYKTAAVSVPILETY